MGPDEIAAIERLPKFLLCVPLFLQWVWLGVRHRSFTLPALVNPCMASGGIVGESKYECLALIGPEHADFVAQTHRVRAGSDDAERIRQEAGLSFPLIVKPDIGWCGYGVRRVENIQALRDYAEAFPKGGVFLLQDLVRAPLEASIAYGRWPGEARGKILSITLRHAPQITGDGVKTIAMLIDEDARLSRKRRFFARSLSSDFLKRVPGRGERVVLTTIASQRVGSRYEHVRNEPGARLIACIDTIACSMGEFHYGRFDVRSASMDALDAGNFTILEVNGAGSEAIQYWDSRVTLINAFRGIFAKQNYLFAMGAAMRAQGVLPYRLKDFGVAFFRQLRLTRLYPASN